MFRKQVYQFIGGLGMVLLEGVTVQATMRENEQEVMRFDDWVISERPIATEFGVQGTPQWSPDGRYLLAYGSRRREGTDFYGLAILDPQRDEFRILRERRWDVERQYNYLPCFGWLDSQRLWTNRNWWEAVDTPSDALVVVDLETNRSQVLPHVFDRGWPLSLVILPGGERFVSVSRGTLQVAPSLEGLPAVPQEPATMPVSDFLKGRIVRLEARDPYHVVVETREDRETEGSSTTIERLYEWNPGTLGARPRQLPLRGTKYDWRLSPDGRQVAYAMGKGMYYTSVDIFDLSSWENRAEIAKFTEWGQSAGQLSWSPDGQRLAMVTREGIRIVDLTMNASIDVLLSKPEDSSEKVSVLFPEWSYDGRWLAAHLYSSRSSPCVLLPGDRLDDRPLEFNKRIALIAPHIGRMKVLSVKGEHMVWSPSDNRLAVIWGGLRILSFSKAKSS